MEIDCRAAAGEEGAGTGAAKAMVPVVDGKKTSSEKAAAATMIAGSTGLPPKRIRKKFVAPIAKSDPDSIEKAHQEAR